MPAAKALTSQVDRPEKCVVATESISQMTTTAELNAAQAQPRPNVRPGFAEDALVGKRSLTRRFPLLVEFTYSSILLSLGSLGRCVFSRREESPARLSSFRSGEVISNRWKIPNPIPTAKPINASSGSVFNRLSSHTPPNPNATISTPTTVSRATHSVAKAIGERWSGCGDTGSSSCRDTGVIPKPTHSSTRRRAGAQHQTTRLGKGAAKRLTSSGAQSNGRFSRRQRGER